jgi:hypothetical protein
MVEAVGIPRESAKLFPEYLSGLLEVGWGRRNILQEDSLDFVGGVACPALSGSERLGTGTAGSLPFGIEPCQEDGSCVILDGPLAGHHPGDPGLEKPAWQADVDFPPVAGHSGYAAIVVSDGLRVA